MKALGNPYDTVTSRGWSLTGCSERSPARYDPGLLGASLPATVVVVVDVDASGDAMGRLIEQLEVGPCLDEVGCESDHLSDSPRANTSAIGDSTPNAQPARSAAERTITARLASAMKRTRGKSRPVLAYVPWCPRQLVIVTQPAAFRASTASPRRPRGPATRRFASHRGRR